MRRFTLGVVVMMAVGCGTLYAQEVTVSVTIGVNTTINYQWPVQHPEPVETVDAHVVGGILRIVEPAWIYGSLTVHNTSVVDFVGGSIGSFRGGQGPESLSAYDASQIIISGGLVNAGVYARDSSTVNISGGTIEGGVYARDSTIVGVSGGRLMAHLAAYDSSAIDITGGYVNHVYAYNSSRVTVSNGAMDSLSASGSSTVNLSGGGLRDPRPLYAMGSGTINIFGTGFNYPRGPIPDSWGELIGILSNGDPINAGFSISGPNASIIIVPEPSTLSLAAMAALGGPLVYTLRRRRPTTQWPVG